MDEFGSLQGRTYELSGLAGAVCALRSFKPSEICEKQIARITSQLDKFNLRKIYQQFEKEFDISALDLAYAKSARSVLSSRLFQGYVQGFCETEQFVKSLPCRGQPLISWIYANPSLGQDAVDALSLAEQELSLIADLSNFDLNTLGDTGKCPYSDFLYIVRTYENNRYRFHLVGYELSTHNMPTIAKGLNLSEPDDVYESLRRGNSAMANKIRTRDFRIASETFGLEISPDLKDYFRGLLTHDKIAKKLFQGGGYVFSLYDTIKDRIIRDKPFDRWVPGQGNIEFHIVAFTDRGRHFLHVKEDEWKLLQEMGTIYKGIQSGRYQTSQEKRKLQEREVLKTQEAVLRNIRKNSSPELRKSLHSLYDAAKKTFLGKKPLPGYLNHSFTERIEGYCPTGTPPTSEQLRSWLPLEIAESIQHADMKSMQDAHAELVKYAWTQYDADIFVMSGTPGIGKTTALRNILANYDSGYSLIYISPRIQVNADLIAKFDPSDDGNRLAGKEELVCLTTNSVLISTAQAHYGRPALSCCSRELPDDPKFLFLRPEDAEALETRTFANPAEPSRNRTGYKSLEKGGAGEGTGSFGHGVFNTMMQAVHRLNVRHNYKRIIACVSTQSNRQLDRGKTTFSVHLKKVFGIRGEWDIASVEKFAKNVRELVFFIDEVTGDRAGRQTAQEIIRFRKEVKMLFEEAGKSCPIRFRIIIADASLVNASSVETFLNRTTSQPDQILFNGDADSKGLSIEDARIMGLPVKIINANVYPASNLTVRWRPVLSFSGTMSGGRTHNPVSEAYRDLESGILEKLAVELVHRVQQRPREQTIVIIQNKLSVSKLREHIAAYARASRPDCPDAICPDVICLDAYSTSEEKRRIVSPASDEEKTWKDREVPVSQKGDLYDIIIMTSSGTRGISFPNATKIICVIPFFSLENNFMEFLQGVYRGRGGGKGNRLDREIELIIPQVLVESSEASEASQIANLSATQMILRMSIFTRIFGACDLFGKPVSCIPISGNLVEGVAQTVMDNADSAIRSLEHAHKQDPGNTDLRYVQEHIRDIFKHENVILHNTSNHASTLISKKYRNRLLRNFVQDANRGFGVIAAGDYIPEGCYTAGELMLQYLGDFSIREKNRHLIETHLEDTHKKIVALCAKLRRLGADTVRQIRDPASILLSVMNVLSHESESDTESETKGSSFNRWLVVPLSAMHIDEFWKNQPDPHRFKAEMKKMLEHYFRACLCSPNYVLPIQSNYDESVPPWLLVRGPEIAQRIDAQFQTRYVVSSKSLALLNIMLLGKNSNQGAITNDK